MQIEIINYVREAKKHGLTDVEIKQNLLDAGWEAQAVEESFAYIRAEETKTPFNKDEDMRAAVFPEKSQTQPQLAAYADEAPAHEQLNMTEQQFKQPGKAGIFKRPVFWIVLSAIIILGGGGYFAFANLYNNPGKVWEKFATNRPGDKVYTTSFAVRFSDTVISAGSSTPSSLAVGLQGSAYTDKTDLNNPRSSADFNISFAGSGVNVSKNFKYRYFDNNFYLYFGQLPAQFSMLLGGQQYEWLKLDMNALSETLKQAFTASSSTPSDFASFKDKLNKQFEDIWAKAQPVKMDKYLGKEKVGDVNTYHFQNSLDKAVLVKALSDSFNVIADSAASMPGTRGEVTQADKDAFVAIAQAAVNKIQVKAFETWIGTKDFRLYKVHFVSSAPSLDSLVSSSVMSGLSVFGSAGATSRDTKRLSDVQHLATALDSYYTDFGGYPAATNGKPAALAPNYIGEIPQTPVPADGSCSNYYNTYWYEPTGKAFTAKGQILYPEYKLYSCLGSNTEIYKAGILMATPQGLRDGQPCVGGADKCASAPVSSSPSPAEQAQQQIAGLNFGAEFVLDTTYSNYGQAQTLEAPPAYFDILKELQNLIPSLNASGTIPNTLNLE